MRRNKKGKANLFLFVTKTWLLTNGNYPWKAVF
jgi:hypothetical protein